VTVADSDPRAVVEAPVRLALNGIVLRGMLGFALLALAVACPAPLGLDPMVHEAIHLAVPCLLIAVIVLVLGERIVRGRPPEATRDAAWVRAREMAPDEARLAAIAVAALPVALLGSLMALALPHLLDRSQLPTYVGLWIPLLIILTALTSAAWMDHCRDSIARAVADSEVRFRGYWAGLSG
jgi:hypothetical protein